MFDGLLARGRQPAQFYRALPGDPFTASTGAVSKPSEAIVDNWWPRDGGGSQGPFDCIKAFSQTDFTEDLKKIDVPMLIIHGEDDQSSPTPTPARCRRSWSRTGRLKSYQRYPHGMPTTQAETINADLLTFIQS